MKTKRLLLAIFGLMMMACSSDDERSEARQINKVLMLKVDYTTNAFQGGTEFLFQQQSTNFTIAHEYKAPGDFGSVKLVYEEINEGLFFGTIVWMGLGEMEFPENLQPANQFQRVETEDYVLPANGFENVFDPNDQFGESSDYLDVWSSVQSLVKVRSYLNSNPDQTVQLFLYAPSVGLGNPADWYWIIYLKK